MVEAAGVEPASGKVYREEPTYLVRSKVSAGSLERTRKNRPSPINFSLRLRTEACGQSREMTLYPAVRARRKERADLIRRRRLTACCYWQLLFSDMPLHDGAIPSNPLLPPFFLYDTAQPKSRLEAGAGVASNGCSLRPVRKKAAGFFEPCATHCLARVSGSAPGATILAPLPGVGSEATKHPGRKAINFGVWGGGQGSPSSRSGYHN